MKAPYISSRARPEPCSMAPDSTPHSLCSVTQTSRAFQQEGAGVKEIYGKEAEPPILWPPDATK